MELTAPLPNSNLGGLGERVRDLKAAGKLVTLTPAQSERQLTQAAQHEAAAAVQREAQEAHRVGLLQNVRDRIAHAMGFRSVDVTAETVTAQVRADQAQGVPEQVVDDRTQGAVEAARVARLNVQVDTNAGTLIRQTTEAQQTALNEKLRLEDLKLRAEAEKPLEAALWKLAQPGGEKILDKTPEGESPAEKLTRLQTGGPSLERQKADVLAERRDELNKNKIQAFGQMARDRADQEMAQSAAQIEAARVRAEADKAQQAATNADDAAHRNAVEAWAGQGVVAGSEAERWPLTVGLQQYYPETGQCGPIVGYEPKPMEGAKPGGAIEYDQFDALLPAGSTAQAFPTISIPLPGNERAFLQAVTDKALIAKLEQSVKAKVDPEVAGDRVSKAPADLAPSHLFYRILSPDESRTLDRLKVVNVSRPPK